VISVMLTEESCWSWTRWNKAGIEVYRHTYRPMALWTSKEEPARRLFLRRRSYKLTIILVQRARGASLRGRSQLSQ